MSDVWLEPHERTLLVSKTRSGKSTVAQVIASYFECRVVLIDVKRRYSMPDAYVARGVEALYATPAEARLVHFIPTAVDSPTNKRAEDLQWHQVFDWVAQQHDLVVLLDECAPKPAPATGAPGSLRLVYGQKAVDRVGVIACSGRWRGIALELKVHSDHILVWPGGAAVDERKDIAKEMGISLDDLDSLLADTQAVGDYAFLWFDRNRELFRIVPPLPEGLRARAIATEVAP